MANLQYADENPRNSDPTCPSEHDFARNDLVTTEPGSCWVYLFNHCSTDGMASIYSRTTQESYRIHVSELTLVERA